MIQTVRFDEWEGICYWEFSVNGARNKTFGEAYLTTLEIVNVFLHILNKYQIFSLTEIYFDPIWDKNFVNLSPVWDKIYNHLSSQDYDSIRPEEGEALNIPIEMPSDFYPNFLLDKLIQISGNKKVLPRFIEFRGKTKIFFKNEAFVSDKVFNFSFAPIYFNLVNFSTNWLEYFLDGKKNSSFPMNADRINQAISEFMKSKVYLNSNVKCSAKGSSFVEMRDYQMFNWFEPSGQPIIFSSKEIDLFTT
ncbi:hypothetical protein LNQ82_04235 [Conchiformibius steedae DSM 2580]|uniref:Uncharacterized protein n=1 Tax=Conchiformibius steedae DSM 2580 TaxID=1121352 RepID=A0AAE9HXQ6_9NEIS|nr:hypothetical protein [Conchiformibius steedae]QMT33709.1 hypothetical protein H3L98_01310 [Conchiformibius steedae]URD68370.1 hypothetical protein LNQ82_04235 [Conchiformibius steedae DSM 2580]